MNIEEKLDLVLNYFKRNKKHNDNESFKLYIRSV
jgi:hypothetical protein